MIGDGIQVCEMHISRLQLAAGGHVAQPLCAMTADRETVQRLVLKLNIQCIEREGA